MCGGGGGWWVGDHRERWGGCRVVLPEQNDWPVWTPSVEGDYSWARVSWSVIGQEGDLKLLPPTLYAQRSTPNGDIMVSHLLSQLFITL